MMRRYISVKRTKFIFGFLTDADIQNSHFHAFDYSLLTSWYQRFSKHAITESEEKVTFLTELKLRPSMICLNNFLFIRTHFLILQRSRTYKNTCQRWIWLGTPYIYFQTCSRAEGAELSKFGATTWKSVKGCMVLRPVFQVWRGVSFWDPYDKTSRSTKNCLNIGSKGCYHTVQPLQKNFSFCIFSKT